MPFPVIEIEIVELGHSKRFCRLNYIQVEKEGLPSEIKDKLVCQNVTFLINFGHSYMRLAN